MSSNRAKAGSGSYPAKRQERHLKESGQPGAGARRLAVDLLTSVLQKGKPLDETFSRLIGETGNSLEARDKAFARIVTATALRRRGQCMAVIGTFLDKPLPEKRGLAAEILLSAAAQLLFLKTPPHAAINLAVEQARRDPAAKRFRGLINAVLRRVCEQGPAIVNAQDAGRLNTPAWLWERWERAYGEETARRIAAQHLREAPLDLTVKSEPEAWARKLGGIALPTGSVRLAHKGRIEDIEGYDGGEWWVQDAAAALPVKLLGDLRGLRIADLCAAPGGKTAQLSLAGGEVTAIDISGPRLKRLEENLARLKLPAKLVEADGAAWKADEPFDAVFLDAPCTATGTIRRHPDIPHLKKPADIVDLAALQRRLLDHALTLLKPGGRLVYCVCSLEPEEGPEQIRDLIRRTDGVKPDPATRKEIDGCGEWLTAEGWLRTLPCHLQLSGPELSGMDGFFAARLVKRG